MVRKTKIELTSVSNLHLEILAGISSEDLTNRALLSFAKILVKEYKRASKFERSPALFKEDEQYEDWCKLKKIIVTALEEAIDEVSARMIPTLSEEDEDYISGSLLVSYLAILGDLKTCLQEEQTEQTEVVTDVGYSAQKNVQAVKRLIEQQELFKISG